MDVGADRGLAAGVDPETMPDVRRTSGFGLRAEMGAHALDALPAEACGAVFGRTDRTGRIRPAVYRPLRNAAADPCTGFAIDPFELCVVEGEERDAGRALLGLFHSHPSGGAEPSPTDRRADWPGVRCWIGAFDRDGAFVVAAHRLTGSRLGARTDAQNRTV